MYQNNVRDRLERLKIGRIDLCAVKNYGLQRTGSALRQQPEEVQLIVIAPRPAAAADERKRYAHLLPSRDLAMKPSHVLVDALFERVLEHKADLGEIARVRN